ncbi:MAG: tetratricopeptide repeat protein [Leptospirales bacterium]
MTPEEVVALEERLEANPKSRSFLQLAEAYLEHGKTEKALPLLVQGVEYYPYYLAARITLGQVQKKQGFLDDAVKNFEFVTRTIPDNLIAQKNLALLFFARGEKDKAREALSLALGLSPNDNELLALQEEILRPEANLLEVKEDGPAPPEATPQEAVLENTLPPSVQVVLETEEVETPNVQMESNGTALQETPDEMIEPSGETSSSQDNEEDDNENELLHLIPQTETMGDLFMSQKRYPQAEKIYAAILNQSPGNSRISKKLDLAKSHTPLDEDSLLQAETPEGQAILEEPEPTPEEQLLPAEEIPVSLPEPEPVGSSHPVKIQSEHKKDQNSSTSDELVERLKDRLYRDLIGIIFASENGLLLSDHSRDENSEILAAEGIELLRQLDELALSLGQGAPLDGFIWLERSILYFINRSPQGGLFLWLRPNANIGRCRLIIQQELGNSSQGGSTR